MTDDYYEKIIIIHIKLIWRDIIISRGPRSFRGCTFSNRWCSEPEAFLFFLIHVYSTAVKWLMWINFNPHSHLRSCDASFNKCQYFFFSLSWPSSGPGPGRMTSRSTAHIFVTRGAGVEITNVGLLKKPRNIVSLRATPTRVNKYCVLQCVLQ